MHTTQLATAVLAQPDGGPTIPEAPPGAEGKQWPDGLEESERREYLAAVAALAALEAGRSGYDEVTDLELREELGREGGGTTTYTAVDAVSVADAVELERTAACDGRALAELGHLPTEPVVIGGVAGEPVTGDAPTVAPVAAGARRRFGELPRRPARAPSEPTVRLRVRGSRPPQPREAAAWLARRPGAAAQARAGGAWAVDVVGEVEEVEEVARGAAAAPPARFGAASAELPARGAAAAVSPTRSGAASAELPARGAAASEPARSGAASAELPARGAAASEPARSGAASAALAARVVALSSTAPGYPLVALAGAPAPAAVAAAPGARGAAAYSGLSASRTSAPAAGAERPIAWGRVVAAIALASALIGGVAARFVYRPRGAAGEGGAGGAGGGDGAAPVAVLPFESHAADPALRDAPRAFARALADELRAETVIAPAAPGPGEAAPPGAILLRGSLADDPAGGVRLRVELARPGDRPVTVLDRRAAPAEVAAALRGGVPAFAGLLVDPRELPRYLAQGRRALVEGRLPDAIRHLRTILLYDPHHAGALFERAVAARWAEPADAAVGAIGEALVAPQPPLQRDVLVAHRHLAEGRLADALAAFSELAARSPEEPHVLLGLFEAQLRSGRGGEAVVTYARLRQIEPRAQLGARQARAYAAEHAEVQPLLAP